MMIKNIISLAVILIFSVNSAIAVEPPGSIDGSFSCIDLEKEIKNSTEEIAKLIIDLKISVDSFISGSTSKDKFAADQRDITARIAKAGELLKYFKYLYNRDCNPRTAEPMPMPSIAPSTPLTPQVQPPTSIPTTPIPGNSLPPN